MRRERIGPRRSPRGSAVPTVRSDPTGRRAGDRPLTGVGFAPGARQMLRRCSPLSSGRLAELRCMLGSPVGSPARGVFLFSGRKSSARHVLRRLCSPRLSSGRLAEHHCIICSLVDLWQRLGFFCASSCCHCVSLIQSPRLLRAWVTSGDSELLYFMLKLAGLLCGSVGGTHQTVLERGTAGHSDRPHRGQASAVRASHLN